MCLGPTLDRASSSACGAVTGADEGEDADADGTGVITGADTPRCSVLAAVVGVAVEPAASLCSNTGFAVRSLFFTNGVETSCWQVGHNDFDWSHESTHSAW